MGSAILLFCIFVGIWFFFESFWWALIITIFLTTAFEIDVNVAQKAVIDAIDKIEQSDKKIIAERRDVELNPNKHYTEEKTVIIPHVLPSKIAEALNLEPAGIRDRLRKSDNVDISYTDGLFRACRNEGLGPCFNNPDFLMHDTGVVYACIPRELSCYVVRGNDG